MECDAEFTPERYRGAFAAAARNGGAFYERAKLSANHRERRASMPRASNPRREAREKYHAEARANFLQIL